MAKKRTAEQNRRLRAICLRTLADAIERAATDANGRAQVARRFTGRRGAQLDDAGCDEFRALSLQVADYARSLAAEREGKGRHYRCRECIAQVVPE